MTRILHLTDIHFGAENTLAAAAAAEFARSQRFDLLVLSGDVRVSGDVTRLLTAGDLPARLAAAIAALGSPT